LRAWIFGSHARGEANIESDVDIWVEFDYDSKIGWEFITMQNELQNALGKKVDLVSSRDLSPFIGLHIEAEKELIYERFAKRQGAD
jgi:predicted nucleotidyltransferase